MIERLVTKPLDYVKDQMVGVHFPSTRQINSLSHSAMERLHQASLRICCSWTRPILLNRKIALNGQRAVYTGVRFQQASPFATDYSLLLPAGGETVRFAGFHFRPVG